MEIGIYSFGENTADPRSGAVISASRRLRNLLEEIELADQVGQLAQNRRDIPRDIPAVLYRGARI